MILPFISEVWPQLSLVRYDPIFHWWGMILPFICNAWSYLSLVRYDHTFHLWGISTPFIGEVWPHLSLVRYDSTFHFWGMTLTFISEVWPYDRYDSTCTGMNPKLLVRYEPTFGFLLLRWQNTGGGFTISRSTMGRWIISCYKNNS